MRIAVPEPRGPFWASNESRSLKPATRFLFGPALSAWILLVNVFGRLMLVLVASSVPLRAGWGRPETADSFNNDCSWVAFGFFESVCAVLRSISFSIDVAGAGSTLGLSGQTSSVSSGIAVVACTSCNNAFHDFFSFGRCTFVFSGFG